MAVLRETHFTNLGERKVGKVRDIYIQPERLILVSTDRHSSFDRIIAHVPHKGQVLNQISAFWFDQTKDIVPNHVIAVPDPNVTVGKKCTLIPVEAVVRGYLTGVTDTSIWHRYQKGMREFGGVTLGDNLKKNTPLPEPLFDPTTKEDTHDRAITTEQMIAEGMVTKEVLEKVRSTALKLFKRGQDIATQKGLILVDTKYEFGLDERGELVLIDEIHTPDSSRYWFKKSYDERLAAGLEPEYFDKEFLRLWFKENSDPYGDAQLPDAPAELVSELSRRYIQMYELITGVAFKPGEEPAEQRIERNLRNFAV